MYSLFVILKQHNSPIIYNALYSSNCKMVSLNKLRIKFKSTFYDFFFRTNATECNIMQ